MNIHFSSKTDLWSTPQKFFDELNKIYCFDIDVCANMENAKCKDFFSLEQDGLRQEWLGNCWMNPPYGREISKWIKKAYESSLKGATVVCLLPARTDTRWFHDYCINGKVEFIKGRLKFGNSKNAAPFPSMIVVFGKKYKAESEIELGFYSDGSQAINARFFERDRKDKLIFLNKVRNGCELLIKGF